MNDRNLNDLQKKLGHNVAAIFVLFNVEKQKKAMTV